MPDALREDAPEDEVNGAAANRKLRFIDLFCGIGGFRIAFKRAGAECVFYSDWDKFSRPTCAANFGQTQHGDITRSPTTCGIDLVAGSAIGATSLWTQNKKRFLSSFRSGIFGSWPTLP